jgi:hypothetical protein
MNRKRILQWVVGLAVAVIAFCGAAVGFVAYINWRAERSARAFCGAILIGSEIGTATSTAKDAKIFFGESGGQYTFYFPGVIFDKAVCEVSVSKEGKVISRKAEMEWD